MAELQNPNRRHLELLTDFAEAELKGIHDAVRWAVPHPEHNFSGILSGIRDSNQDIHLFFCKLGASMRRLA